MAQREALHTIRAARAGHAAAQLELGKRYLFGGGGLPKNSASALYWLDRAAQQQQEDAWVLIGSYIPFETAQYAANMQKLCFWYQRAFEAGVLQAGIVFAKLVMAHVELLNDAVKREFALQAIRVAAEAGHGEAQWLWAQVCRGDLAGLTASTKIAVSTHEGSFGQENIKFEEWQRWAERAAEKGMEGARHALESDAWNKQDHLLYLKWALSPARAILQAVAHSSKVLATLSVREVELLKRCAIALEETRQTPPEEIQPYWQAAAQAGDADAQLSLGLILAKMDNLGRRTETGPGRVVYKKALRWLEAAAEQGVPDALYAISRVYMKVEFAQRNNMLAQEYLQRAAQAGHLHAQLELGKELWRKGGDNDEDVLALYWLSQAAAQGSEEARAWIGQHAAGAAPQAWAKQAGSQLGLEQLRNEQMRNSRDQPSLQYLAARVELALHFGLSRAEALLLDIVKADRGHCLVIDIRAHHPRSKRRLIAIQDDGMRQAVSRINRLFQEVDSSEHGPEGNYRRRLYRLRSLTAQAQIQVRAVPGVISRFRLQTP